MTARTKGAAREQHKCCKLPCCDSVFHLLMLSSVPSLVCTLNGPGKRLQHELSWNPSWPTGHQVILHDQPACTWCSDVAQADRQADESSELGTGRVREAGEQKNGMTSVDSPWTSRAWHA